MDNELMDTEESLNPQDGEETTPEDTEQPNQELIKAQELATNQKIRAEKAESELKKLKSQKVEEEQPKKTSEDNFSLKDIRALNSVHDEDVDKVVKYAKLENISIPEAVRSPIMQVILREADEQRKTAKAANTGGGKRGVSKLSDEAILAEVEKGNISEKYEDIERFAEARHNLRMERKI